MSDLFQEIAGEDIDNLNHHWLQEIRKDLRLSPTDPIPIDAFINRANSKNIPGRIIIAELKILNELRVLDEEDEGILKRLIQP